MTGLKEYSEQKTIVSGVKGQMLSLLSPIDSRKAAVYGSVASRMVILWIHFQPFRPLLCLQHRGRPDHCAQLGSCGYGVEQQLGDGVGKDRPPATSSALGN